MPRSIKVCFVLIGLCHLILLAGLRYHHLSYDAFIHMFMAHTFEDSFFHFWNNRWYGGFDQLSYPPFVHQLIAFIANFSNTYIGYGVVHILALGQLAYGVVLFARIFVSRSASWLAGGLVALSSAVFQTAYVFGQLPTLFALGAMLLGVVFFYRWCQEGVYFDLARAVLFFALVIASHHITGALSAPFFLLPAVFRLSKTMRLNPRVLGNSIWGGAIILFSCLFFCLPFIYFMQSSFTEQVEIPHGSRSNLLANPANLIFFVGIPLLSVAPTFLSLKSFRSAPIPLPWELMAAAAAALLFGLGGTTPVPRLILGPFYNILTFDRFVLWACILIMIFMSAPLAAAHKRLMTSIIAVSIAATCFVGVKFFQSPVQPRLFDKGDVVAFLNQPENQSFRFLTLGFGAQFAEVGFLSQAQNIDGLYHTARRNPVLRQSGIETVDSAKYFGQRGMDVLLHFLQRPDRYHLRHVFSRDRYYEPHLLSAGWRIAGKFGPPSEGQIYLWKPLRDSSPLPSSAVKHRVLSRGHLLAAVNFFLLLMGIFACVVYRVWQ